MSIDIHISNYEEYLYSYVDGELSPEEAAALEAFVAAHPQVRAELDQLLAVKLTPDTPVFDNKASLYRQAAAPERNYETVLLEYLDGELAPAEARALETFMEEHPALRAEMAVWEKTRLQPDLSVTFGDKSTLYRHAEKQRVVRMDRRLWWAAAAMLAGSLFLLRNSFRSGDSAVITPPVAVVGQPAAPAVTPPAETPLPSAAPATENNTAVLADAKPQPRAAAAKPAPPPAAQAPPKEASAPETRAEETPATSGALLALNAIDRQSPREDAPAVNAGISGTPAGIRQQPAPAVKTSIDMQHTASLATAAPEPPGELIMSVTGNGIESKVLDKVTNVARIFAKKRNK
ncbi:anti-sigma factor [Chitinophaga sp.]|uniref:anti-sigma factor family protein n=1 Tax=Chitinophaga sp. TaxID=1869181 RepID=UPI00261EA664|nr:zf-HC2 domain-containing protein [uncultured Chitinophaga sp.]